MKRLFNLLVGVCLVGLLAGCGGAKSTLSYTYNVETGDSIKVTLETQTGYNMTKDLPTTFTKKDTEDYEAKGLFLDKDSYDSVVSQVNASGSSVTILETGHTVEDNDYMFFSEDMGDGMTQYSFVLHVNDSDTYYMMSTISDRDLFEENFDMLTFEAK